MAAAGTVAVLLPTANYFIREAKKPPVTQFRAAGVPMAVATNCNEADAATCLQGAKFLCIHKPCKGNAVTNAPEPLKNIFAVRSLERVFLGLEEHLLDILQYDYPRQRQLQLQAPRFHMQRRMVQ